MKEFENSAKIVMVYRFFCHLSLIIWIFIKNNGISNASTSTIATLQVFACFSFFVVFFVFLFSGVIHNAVRSQSVSTNRSLVQMAQLSLWHEIEQMEKFGYIYKDVEWKKAANIKIEEFAFGFTSLMVASRTGNWHCVRKLIQVQPDIINKCTAKGKNSALMIACDKDHCNCVLTLINSGADIAMQNSDGYTPLMYAAWKCQTGECVVLLLEAGADVGVVNAKGRNALYMATERRKEHKIMPLQRDIVSKLQPPPT